MRKLSIAFLVLVLCSCAGMQRECTSCCASELGSDWVIVQMDGFGRVMRCWELHDVSVANESSSDGIYWQSEDGHLVHISGFYNRVQVDHGGWDEAYAELGLTKEVCTRVRAGTIAVQPEMHIKAEVER